MIYYITIGNSDNKLTQADWSAFCAGINAMCRHYSSAIHGEWHSLPSSPWQNANWCVEIYQKGEIVDDFKNDLTEIAKFYRQDSIAFATVGELEFLRPSAALEEADHQGDGG